MTSPLTLFRRMCRLARPRHFLAGLVVLLSFFAIAVLVLDLRQQVRVLEDSTSGALQYTLGQTEVELMALEIAALRADAGLDALEEVRVRYDVFYSRVQTLTESTEFAALLDYGIIPSRIAEITDFRATWLPVIDGPNANLRAALTDMATEARATRETVHDATLAGVAFFSAKGMSQRDSLSNSMGRAGGLTMALLATMAVLSLAMFRFARRSDAEARQNRAIRERIETILSNSLDAVIVSDAYGRIIEYNGAAERIFGYSRSEAIDADMADLIIPDSFRAAHRAGIAHYNHGHKSKVIGKGILRMEAKRRDGTVFPIDMSLASAHGPEGEIFIAFLRDISARVRNEAALKRARDRAIAGEKQKAEVLAVMSHEMRTPLNGMLGTLELIDQAAFDKRHQRFLRIIKNSGKVLLRHVNEVLDISRLDAGKMSLRKIGFDLVDLLNEVVDNQLQNAKSHGNALVLVPPSPELHEVHGDPDRLRQIMLNLVHNAIKFTRNGRITIEADCSGGLDAVELRVTDTGIGIDDADLHRVFEDFVTMDSTYGRSTSGTGLGLGISQRLASALDGELGVESEPGDGSVFWLRLPLAPPSQGTPDVSSTGDPPAEPAQKPPPSNILLVEDNETNRVVGRELLEHDGHNVETAASGELALRLARTQQYDVILMDISMPGMDGLDVARSLRAGTGVNASTPIIATTAHALPHEIDAFLAAGMQAVLIKPLTLNAIRAALAAGLAAGLDGVLRVTLAAESDEIIDMAHLRDMHEHLTKARIDTAHASFVREMSSFMTAVPDLTKADEVGLTALAAEAHRMSGSAAVLGAGRLRALLQKIQHSAQAQDHRALAAQIDELSTCWAATRAALATAFIALEPSA